jgi:hypothetical protein
MKRNIATRIRYHFLFIPLLFLSGCVHQKYIDKQILYTDNVIQKITSPESEPPPITIWVHGTLIFRTPSYHNIFNKKSGLVPATSLPQNNHFRILADTMAHNDPDHFPLEEFYIFSWSGKIRDQERKTAAEKLYTDLLTLIDAYQKKYHSYPIIRIIAHSHGGNVALKMAKIKNSSPTLHIKSLILLACPVQDKTMNLISTPLFERVYSLYSSLDIIQIIAPQFRRGSTIGHTTIKKKRPYRIPLFSSRIFPHYQHLTQAKIKINHLPISHTAFSTNRFVAILPQILQKLDIWDAYSEKINTLHKHKLLCIYTDRKKYHPSLKKRRNR